ncbi:MAG: sugar ABC transporter permease [Thermocladium sp.]|jgi:multiple sugar transport system permease protein
MNGKEGKSNTTGYLFILPAFALIISFMLFPAAFSLLISLMHYDLFFHEIYPVGLLNYATVLSDPLFRISLLHALEYTAIVVPVQTLLAFAFALIFNEETKLARITRATVFIPAVTSSAVMSVLFIYVFSSAGLLNAFLRLFGIHPQNWLLSTTWAFPAIMALNIFSTTPYFMVMFLASLQSIPSSIMDAAAIDGVRTAIQRARFFYVPLLRFSFFFVAVLGIIGSMQLFDQVYIMTAGGPGTSTYVPLMYIYNEAFIYDNFGVAAAASFVLFIIIMALTITQRKLIPEIRWA